MIDSVNSGQSFAASAASAQKPGAVMQQVLTSAASEFGMSTSDLATALQAGQGLSDIAQQKGVSQSDVLATVTQALNTASANGATLPGDTSTTAQQIVDHKGVGGHHHSQGSAGAGGRHQRLTRQASPGGAQRRTAVCRARDSTVAPSGATHRGRLGS